MVALYCFRFVRENRFRLMSHVNRLNVVFREESGMDEEGRP